MRKPQAVECSLEKLNAMNAMSMEKFLAQCTREYMPHSDTLVYYLSGKMVHVVEEVSKKELQQLNLFEDEENENSKQRE